MVISFVELFLLIAKTLAVHCPKKERDVVTIPSFKSTIVDAAAVCRTEQVANVVFEAALPDFAVRTKMRSIAGADRVEMDCFEYAVHGGTS